MRAQREACYICIFVGVFELLQCVTFDLWSIMSRVRNLVHTGTEDLPRIDKCMPFNQETSALCECTRNVQSWLLCTPTVLSLPILTIEYAHIQSHAHAPFSRASPQDQAAGEQAGKQNQIKQIALSQISTILIGK